MATKAETKEELPFLRPYEEEEKGKGDDSSSSDGGEDGKEMKERLLFPEAEQIRFVTLTGETKTVSLKTVKPLKMDDVSSADADDEILYTFPHGITLTTKKITIIGLLLSALATILILVYALAPPISRTTRRFYISIDEVEWDYLGEGGGELNNCTGEPFAYPETKWVGQGDAEAPRIGNVYTKAVFRRYTDAGFHTLWEDADATKWSHLGLLGPALHVQVGDIVEITLRNSARFPFSLSVAGASVNKANEGAAYNEGSRPRPSFWRYDDVVRPLSLGVRDCGIPDSFMTWDLPTSTSREGDPATHNRIDYLNDQDRCQNFEVLPAEARTYAFLVDEASGPGPEDPSSVLRLYSSHVGGQSMVDRDAGYAGFGEDISAGLVGPLIVSREGLARIDPPPDVDREVVVLMAAFDENESPYLRHNIHNRITKPLLDMDNRPPGHVPFGPTGKVRALQALYAHANQVGDKLSYADAEALVNASITGRTFVDEVRGVRLHVWFDKDFFDPHWYDSRNGGTGTALQLMESLWREAVDVGDPSFRESNMMHAINGYVYCAMPTLDFNVGERVRWHVASVGGAPDGVHTPHWHGHTVQVTSASSYNNDEIDLLAGNTASVDMLTENLGRWMLHCHVNDHKKAGMIGFYDVVNASSAADSITNPPATVCAMDPAGVTREYFIQIEEVQHAYYPEDRANANEDLCAANAAVTGSEAIRAIESNGVDRVGVNFTKAAYVRYTDATYTTRVIEEDDAYRGILGPTLRALVGDRIVVHARNALASGYNVSLHPHGVQYGKGAEGAPYADGTTDAAHDGDDSIAPGETHTYEWCVPASAGPSANDADADTSSVVWLYHDHVHEINGTNAGLVGSIVVTARESGNVTTGRPTDVDKEFVLLFAAINENAALFAEENVATRLPLFDGNDANLDAQTRERLTFQLRRDDAHFADSMRKRSINGFLRCALELEWSTDDRVRFHLLSVGDEENHAPTLEGHSFLHRERRRASVGLMASTMKSVDVSPSTVPGTYLLSSGTTEGDARGMLGKVTVTAGTGGAGQSESSATASAKRTYYVAADEIEWDFLPYGANVCTEDGITSTLRDVRERDGGVAGLGPRGYNGWTDPSNGLESEWSLLTNAHATPHRIGSRYVLAVFREYTGGKFDLLQSGAQSRANPVSRHLGMQGPVLRASPGDRIAVVVRNNLRYAMNFNIFGARAVGGSADLRPILPGETRRVVFDFTGAAFGRKDSADSFAFRYGSDLTSAVVGQAAYDAASSSTSSSSSSPLDAKTNFADFNAGLFGAAIVTRRGDTLSDGAPDDVNREFVLFMTSMDLNRSPYLWLNVRQFAANPDTVDTSDPEFKASNVMTSVNGRMYCNLEGLRVLQGRKSRFYVFALGDASATPRWYGHGVTIDGHHVGAAMVQPGTSVVADLRHDARGSWLVEDQTHNHAFSGASAIFTTIERVTVSCENEFWATC